MKPTPPLQPEDLAAHGAFVRALAGALLRDPNDADDVAQEAHLAALGSPPRRPGPLRPWLSGVVRNLARRHRRSTARRVRREHAVAVPEAREEDRDAAERAETIARLARAVADLEEPYRTTILLRFFDGLSPGEVAARMGVPLETCRTRLRRALERLRARLGVDEAGNRRLRALVAAPAGLLETAVATSAPVAQGGLIMGTAAKWTAGVAIAALLAGVGVWWAGREPSAEDPVPGRTTSAASTGDGRPSLEGSPSPVPQPPREVASAAGPFAVEGLLRLGGRMPAQGWRVRAIALGSLVPASPWVPTDAQGKYRIEGLQEEAYRVIAKRGPLAEEEEIVAHVVPTSQPGGSTDLVSSLDPRGGFMQRPPKPTDRGDRGRIRLVGHDGGAVAQARVALYYPSSGVRGGLGGYMEVANGEFMRPPMEPWGATYEIYEAVDARGEPLPYGPVRQEFSDANETVATVPLPPGCVVEGVLLGPDGRGVADVVLSASYARDDVTPLQHATTKTGPAGDFRFASLGELPYAIQTLPLPPLPDPRSIESGDWSVRPSRDHVRRIELHLRIPIAVVLTVRDAGNAPMAGATIGVAKQGALPRGPSTPAQWATDGDGRAELQGMDPAGDYVLSVGPPKGRGDLQWVHRERWRPTDQEIVLEPGYAVSGVVQDDSGTLARAYVQVKQADGTMRVVAISQADGTFQVAGLPAGSVTLGASRARTSPVGPTVTVQAGASDVVLSVPPTAPR